MLSRNSLLDIGGLLCRVLVSCGFFSGTENHPWMSCQRMFLACLGQVWIYNPPNLHPQRPPFSVSQTFFNESKLPGFHLFQKPHQIRSFLVSLAWLAFHVYNPQAHERLQSHFNLWWTVFYMWHTSCAVHIYTTEGYVLLDSVLNLQCSHSLGNTILYFLDKMEFIWCHLTYPVNSVRKMLQVLTWLEQVFWGYWSVNLWKENEMAWLI